MLVFEFETLCCILRHYSSVYTRPAKYLVGQIYGHLGVAFTRRRLIVVKLGHLGVHIFGQLGKRPSLELERPSSRTASCKRIWLAKYLHDTTKRVSMCNWEARACD